MNEHVVQSNVFAVGSAVFGRQGMESKKERAMRFFEEACELVIAAGLSESEMKILMEDAVAKDVGELHQELGGAGVTLMGLAHVHDKDLIAEIIKETDRVWQKRDLCRAKHAAKPMSVRAV